MIVKTFEQYRDEEGFPLTSTQEPTWRRCWEAAQDAIYANGPYSSGVLSDGAAILANGEMMTIEQIVMVLNGYDARVAKLKADNLDLERRLVNQAASINALQVELNDTKLFHAGLFAGFAGRVERAEPYLRNGTITRYIKELAGDLRAESNRLMGVDDGSESES